MEITGSSINQPVSFYPKNTGNTINMAINEENLEYIPNLFGKEHKIKEKSKEKAEKKRRKNNRLNAIDSEYITDSVSYNAEAEETRGNFFIQNTEGNGVKKIARKVRKIIKGVPLINYFILKERTKRIEKRVEELNDITQEVEEMINGAVPYGEEGAIYGKIADKLIVGANIVKETNKEIRDN